MMRDISATNYSTTHFFVDTLYRRYYEPQHQAIIPALTPEMIQNEVVQLNVFLSIKNSSQLVNANYEFAFAYTDLPSVHGGSYNFGDLPQSRDHGKFEQAIFTRLIPGQNYTYSPFGGYLNIDTTFTDDQVVAVSYTISKGQTWGGWLGSTDTMVLKLISRDIFPAAVFNRRGIS
ncbi:MAG TPA: hypothetical protein VLY03_02790 [Bacteroidota bacterium]|nr:hypothetical protein [Bacteroidota bacterium]